MKATEAPASGSASFSLVDGPAQRPPRTGYPGPVRSGWGPGVTVTDFATPGLTQPFPQLICRVGPSPASGPAPCKLLSFCQGNRPIDAHAPPDCSAAALCCSHERWNSHSGFAQFFYRWESIKTRLRKHGLHENDGMFVLTLADIAQQPGL